MIAKKYESFMNSIGDYMMYLWKYYSLDKSVIPIYQRKAFDKLKAKSHTNEHVNFFGDIINIKQGYIGESIEISYNDEDEKAKDALNDMLNESHMNTINSQTIEYSSVEGLSHRLLYTEDGIFKQKNLHGWQVIYDGDPYNPMAAYYFYGKEKDLYCQVYTSNEVIYYRKSTDKNKEYIEYDRRENNFNRVPIVPFQNNSNNYSNCNASTGIMDMYDAVLSDSVAELKDLRRALLKVKGDIYTEQDLDGNPIPIPTAIANSSVLVFGSDIDGKSSGDAEYMNNNISDDAVTSSLNRLRGLIYETSGSVDLKELTAAERVFSIKASLLRLENDAKTSENYFKLSMMSVLELWAFIMSETGVNINDKAFEIVVGRKIPMDEAGQAELLLKLSSILSIEDALRLAGYKDPEQLAERAIEVVLPEYNVGE